MIQALLAALVLVLLPVGVSHALQVLTAYRARHPAPKIKKQGRTITTHLDWGQRIGGDG